MAMWCVEKERVCGWGAWINGWWSYTEQSPILVEQNLSELRRSNDDWGEVVMTDGNGHSDSSSVNFISFSSQCILSSVTQGQEVQQTCSNATQGVQTGRPKEPVVEGVENGLSKVRYTPTPYTSGFMYTGLVTKHGSNLFRWEARVGNSDRWDTEFHCWNSQQNIYSFSPGSTPRITNPSWQTFKPEKFDGSSDWSEYLKHFEAVAVERMDTRGKAV